MKSEMSMLLSEYISVWRIITNEFLRKAANKVTKSCYTNGTLMQIWKSAWGLQLY